ncbi:hypothetical protein LJR153_000301 [Paenibacillus sp. LjRoot153]|uniref:hypothetical protein n=1 Tax=Paenibacillus sp. LjRoot153 TaxID=3342270 RepID=UPI003ED06E27
MPNIWLGMLIYSLYTFAIVFVYGIAVSVLIENLLNKANMKIMRLFSGVLHILLGAIGGLAFMNVRTLVFGGVVSLLFFIVDEVLKKHLRARKTLAIISLFPLCFVLFSILLYHPYWKQEDAKFSASQAAQFAVSSQGTYNSLFPDELNKVIQTLHEGYVVTRSTDVEKIGNGNYKVKLIEKWHKTGASGERITLYHVQRKEGGTSSNAAGSVGDTIPYKY